MAEDPQTGLDPQEDPGDPQDPGAEPQEDPQESGDDEKKDPELKRAFDARDREKAKRRELEKKLAELEEKLNPGKQDPIAAAHRKLVGAEARVVLTGRGFTDSDDQKVLLSYLKLDDIEVGPDGEVGGEGIAEQLDQLIEVVRKVTGAGRSPRSPRIDPRDRGGEQGKPVDPARKRRMDMLRG